MTTSLPASNTSGDDLYTENVAGLAALAICEALMLALNDRHVLPEAEILGVLIDAAAAHSNVPEGINHATLHQSVANLIQKIIDGGNSVRRT